MNRNKFLGLIFAFSLLILALPTFASAQYRDRDDDDYYGNNRRSNSNYNRRFLVDAVRRIESNSRSFRRALDRELDNSRYDTTRREDRINDITERFATAVDNLEDSFDNGNNIRSSSDEARLVFQLASDIDRFIYRNSVGGSVENQWSNIRRDLQTVADVYGYNFNRGNRNNDNWNRGGRGNRGNDDWNRNNRNNRNRNNGRYPF